ncbi:hypothetical protein [Domibacillus tundrae]|uniref:hypothetical protein n=1 Tax=Domibacillus tundrae TaxID=1587527 RepID=UPI003391FF04
MPEQYSAAGSPLKDSTFLNLPNSRFYEWCYEKYGLNRGVFNTIDNWLYEYGIVNVLSRRIYLLAFLDFAEASGIRRGEQKYLKFGHGGLSEKLREFLQVQEDHIYSI